MPSAPSHPPDRRHPLGDQGRPPPGRPPEHRAGVERRRAPPLLPDQPPRRPPLPARRPPAVPRRGRERPGGRHRLRRRGTPTRPPWRRDRRARRRVRSDRRPPGARPIASASAAGPISATVGALTRIAADPRDARRGPPPGRPRRSASAAAPDGRGPRGPRRAAHARARRPRRGRRGSPSCRGPSARWARASSAAASADPGPVESATGSAASVTASAGSARSRWRSPATTSRGAS